MSELNREHIIKALECCQFRHIKKNCDECKYHRWIEPTCRDLICQDALALIKELTEENERLRGVGLPDYETYIKLSDAKHAIMDYIGEQTASKYVSSAECKSARGGAEGAMNELDYITPAQVAPIADTVRKMQERLKAEMRNTAKYSFGGREYSVIGEAFIDQIAKEMLEG